MKKILVSHIAGACIGSIVTFFAMQGSNERFHAIAVKDASKIPGERKGGNSAEPFASCPTHESKAVMKIDLGDLFQCDTCISEWYLGMGRIVQTLEIQTGHKFNSVAKLSAGPVEILEEQAAFMKEFLAETERLYSKEISK